MLAIAWSVVSPRVSCLVSTRLWHAELGPPPQVYCAHALEDPIVDFKQAKGVYEANGFDYEAVPTVSIFLGGRDIVQGLTRARRGVRPSMLCSGWPAMIVSTPTSS